MPVSLIDESFYELSGNIKPVLKGILKPVLKGILKPVLKGTLKPVLKGILKLVLKGIPGGGGGVQSFIASATCILSPFPSSLTKICVKQDNNAKQQLTHNPTKRTNAKYPPMTTMSPRWTFVPPTESAMVLER